MHDHSSPARVSTGTKPPLIALTGNPNSGKTTLFNQITGSHQKVANYAGVTVELREGDIRLGGRKATLIDLPGLYSLSAVSPDEEIARDLIVHGIGSAGRPDVIVQVIDGGRLERSLLLTMQLFEQGLPVVIALNMFDEMQRRGILIDPKRLAERLGTPVVPTVGSKGEGVRELLKATEHARSKPGREHYHVPFERRTEEALQRIESLCAESGTPVNRGVAIGILTKEPSAILSLPEPTVARLNSETFPAPGEGTWTDSITSARYRAISALLTEASGPAARLSDEMTGKLDRVFIHRWLGIPIFLLILLLLFETTFTLGAYPMDWIDLGISWLGEAVKSYIPGFVGKALGDGVIAGIGMILVFLPNILILLMGIHLLEDSGYMARAAFLMDRVMRSMGLHGRAFIPLLMGFGCNVPAMLGARVLESRRDRLLTMLLTPFMSCSARLPVYVMVTAAFFPENGGLVIFGLYLLGSAAAVGFGKLFSRTLLRGKTAPFMLELPPYRWPTSKTTLMLLKFTSLTFLRRIGGATAIFAIAIWALSSFPHKTNSETGRQDIEATYLYQAGDVTESIFEPLGFNLPMNVALVSGFVAKEVVVATMGILFAGDPEVASETLVEQLRRSIPSTAAALSFLVFVLLYTPCLTTIVTLHKESRDWRWTAFSIGYQTAFAWLAAWGTYRLALAFF